MALLDLASRSSLWSGFDYYKDGKVTSYKKISTTEFSGTVKGSANYLVYVDVEHPRNSTCNCPHADGKRVICKHMVALYFSVYPTEADDLVAKGEKYTEEERLRLKKLHDDANKCIDEMSKEQLAKQLKYVLNTAPDWLYDRFLRDNNIGNL